MSYAPHGRGGHHGYSGNGGGGDRRRQREDSRDDDDSKRQRRDYGGNGNGGGRGGNGNGGDRGGSDRGRGGGDRGRGAPRGRRPWLAPDEWRAQMVKEREELRALEILSFDNVRTRPQGIEDKSGKSGQPLPIIANFYRVTTKGEAWTLHNYRVDFEPEIEKTHEKRQLIRSHERTLRGYIFDGTNLYSPFGDQPAELFSKKEDGSIVRITVRSVGTVEPGDTQYLQVYGIIVRTCLRLMGLDELGRHFFERNASVKIANSRLEIWPGFSVALRCYDGGLMVNVDLRSKVLRLESCLEVIHACRSDQHRVKEELVNNIVITQYNRKTYKVSDIDWEKTPLSTFTCGRGEQKVEKSFMEYYQEKYPGFPIRDSNQPLIVSKPSKKDRHRGMRGNILLIPELCNITGLSDSQRKDFNLMREVHKVTSLEPNRLADRLNGFMRRLHGNAEVQAKFQQWGMSVASNMVEVQGRLLPPENMLMRTMRGNDEEKFAVEPNADWTNNFKGKMKMYSNVELRKWAIVVGDENHHLVQRLLENLRFVGNGLNFRFGEPEIIGCPDTRRYASSYVTGINEALNRVKDCQMVFIIMTNNSSEAYTAIKSRCNIDFGIQSQCFQQKHLAENKMGGLRSVATKVVIQMNAKLGGEPWVGINPFKKSLTMVIGFDVHHSGKGKAKISIGAMVATTNNTYSQFFSTVSNHVNQDNLATNMCADFTKCLMAFRRKNNDLPDRVIMYRDGVGEGDLTYVNDNEVKQILESVKGIYSGTEKTLKFTFIIVTKKGNARLMRRAREIDNPAPGTCVDTIITMPERYDFFLVSQQSRRGQTVSPTTYNVLRVEENFPPDRIQMLTHKFCHLYYNWTGTVSVPFVCQYAHKLSYLTGTTYRDSGALIHENLAHHLYFL